MSVHLHAVEATTQMTQKDAETAPTTFSMTAFFSGWRSTYFWAASASMRADGPFCAVTTNSVDGPMLSKISS